MVIATVVGTRRSAPRPVGSSFAVSSSGALCGSVSGGCVERRSPRRPRRSSRSGQPKLLTYGISDDEALVRRPALRRRDRRVRGESGVNLARPPQPPSRDDGGRAVLFTVVEGDGRGRQVPDRGGRDRCVELAEQADEVIRGARNTLLEIGERKVFDEVYCRRRGCSSTAPSTPPRRSAARPRTSAGRRSSPTRGPRSRPSSASRAPTS